MLSLRYIATRQKRIVLSTERFLYCTATARPFSSTPFRMTTITEAITKDHRELEEYYNEVINSNDHDHQERFGNQFTWELARHSVGEELVVYPAFEKYMGPEGRRMADEDRQEHHKVP
jgi:hemerythrin superfamily protein